MTSWKTTTAAIVGCTAGFITFTPQYFHPMVVDLAKYIMIGGFATIGILGKDADVHSTVAQVQTSTKQEAEKQS